jgi:hypothetical protein
LAANRGKAGQMTSQSIPIVYREEAEDSLSTAQHPATRAWCKLTNSHVIPESIEILQECVRRPGELYRMIGKPSVYRLASLGPGGVNVIAKRCESAAAAAECSIYENVLSHLPVSMLRYYGLVADDDQQFCWLFLEDAGEEPYLLEIEEYRVLAGRWLGLMNVSAQELRAVARLPDRGPGFYLERLLASRETIREILENSSLSNTDSALLRAIISHCDALEGQWGRIARFCNRMPRTLVHGDFAVQNARLRSGPAGTSLMIMDWEGAGWGSPAADLAQFVGESLSPDLCTYYSVVGSNWPRLGLADLESHAELGRMFRLISSLDWTNSGYRAGVEDWYIGELNWCERELADWLRTTDVQDK